MTNSDDNPVARDAAAVRPILLSDARHPYERPRLFLARCASVTAMVIGAILVVETSKIGGLLWGLLGAVFTLATVLLTLQVRRARLLGSAVRVTPDSMPELHQELVALKERLDYLSPIDVYIAENVNGKVMVTSFLGQRVIVIEGDFMVGLDEDFGELGRRVVLGQLLGAVKARHSRLAVDAILLESLDILKYARPLLMPYYRATNYTGDQIGLLCANDLNVTLSTMARQFAGEKLAPVISTDGLPGLIDQAERVQRQPLPRLAELFSDTPHLINRYFNVLAYAATTTPQEFEEYFENLEEDSRRRLEGLLSRTPHSFEQESSARGADSPGGWLSLVGFAAVGITLAVVLNSCGASTNPPLPTLSPPAVPIPSAPPIPSVPPIPDIPTVPDLPFPTS